MSRAWILTGTLAACLAAIPTLGHSEELGLAARYTFDDVEGGVVQDASGNGLHGTIVGHLNKVDGVHGAALRFDGASYVRVAHGTSLAMEDRVARGGELSLTAWVKGRGSRFRLAVQPSTYPSLRGPHFQVVGDTIYFVTNSDQPTSEDPHRRGNFRGPWNDWQLWTGSVNVNLTGWKDVQRTVPPAGGLEAKLVAAGGQLFYQYFGYDSLGVLQLFTARSDLDGSNWQPVQRTHYAEGYRAEQTYNIQVVGERVYASWWQADETANIKPLRESLKPWFGSHATDGSDFRAVRLSGERSFIPSMQIVGDKAYHMYSDGKSLSAKGRPNIADYYETSTFAVSNLDGSNLRVLRRISNAQGVFRISNGKVYMLLSRLSSEGFSHLYSARMDVDGSNFTEAQRTAGRANVWMESSGRIQIVGSKVHYVYTLDDGAWNIPHPDWARGYTTRMWVASENLEGGDWHAEPKTPFAANLLSGYRAIQVVGGKSYFAAYSAPEPATTERHAVRWRPMLGTSGANIISKGDAYGIGLDEGSSVSGFINAGEDYLYRSEAPSDTAGALVAAPLDNRWHHVAVTYNRTTLRLYLDGRLVNERPYQARVGLNAFPILLGDGFEGVLDEVEIYSRAASAEQIRSWSRRYQPRSD